MTQQYDLVAGSGIPGAWSGALYAAQGSAFMLYECAACAAIVRDTTRHDTWHDAHSN
jgi:hypothetical protein